MARRPLTTGEIALARSLFGTSIDYAAVSVFDRGLAAIKALGNMSFRGNIYLPNGHEIDFSLAPIAAKRLFIHESVHVWQHQNGVLNLAASALREAIRHRFRYANAYLFHLDPGKDLLDYGLEQQPAIIEDYFLRAHGGVSMGRCLNESAETQTLLESVLGRFLSDPGYVRRMPPRRAPGPFRRSPPFAAVRREPA